jgi:hypothetical protein
LGKESGSKKKPELKKEERKNQEEAGIKGQKEVGGKSFCQVRKDQGSVLLKERGRGIFNQRSGQKIKKFLRVEIGYYPCSPKGKGQALPSKG